MVKPTMRIPAFAGMTKKLELQVEIIDLLIVN
jgi:hypothetical protein